MIIRFENSQTFQIKPKLIDRQNAVIHDVCSMHVGVALGHGIQADRQTLNIMQDLGNDPKRKAGGVKGRFGHPGISENATGKQVQIANGFKVVDDKLLHTSNLLQSARKSPVFTQDPIEFILDLAENNPTQFGESVVIDSDLVWVLGDESERPLSDDEYDQVGYGLKPPEDATNELPIMRPLEFHFVDYVAEGALTHEGMFSLSSADLSIFAPGKSSYFAKEIFQFLDQWRKAYKIKLEDLEEIVPQKISQILGAYIAYRHKESKFIMSKKDTTEITEVEDEKVTAPGAGADDGGDNLVADLAETESILADVETSLSDETAEQRDLVLGAIGGLQADMQGIQETLTAQIDDLRAYVAQLSKAVVAQARLMQVMDKKLKTLSGERVLTKAVNRTPVTDLEELGQLSAFSFEASGPPAAHDADALLGQTEATPATLRGRELSAAAWANRQAKI